MFSTFSNMSRASDFAVAPTKEGLKGDVDAFGSLFNFDSLDFFDPLMASAAPFPGMNNDDAVIPDFHNFDDEADFGFQADFIIPEDEPEQDMHMQAPQPMMVSAPVTAHPSPAPSSGPASVVLGRSGLDKVKKPRRPEHGRVRYHSRKAYADIRPRIKGRFARKEEVVAYMEAIKQDDGQEEADQEQGQYQEHQEAPVAAAPAAESECQDETDDHAVPRLQ